MDLNKTRAPDFNLLSQEELQQEYLHLFNKYSDLKSQNDENNQQIYELRRNLQTATAAENYLSQELELVLSTQSIEIEKLQIKHTQELEELKTKYSEVASLTQSLEQRVDDLRTENAALKQKIEDMEIQKVQDLPAATTNNTEREQELEEENLELLAKLDQFQEKIARSTMQIAEKERQTEILKEQVKCLEENLQSKREELEEKTNLLESTQERMIEMNAELAILKSQPENENRKGNSLFAEVDDQRQAMKKLLAAQKKSYLHMKKAFNESEHEIRRLKRENAAMHKELQVCTSIFLSAEKMYKEKLNERILQLLKQNKALEQRLAWTEEKLIELSKNKGVNWLDSMLTYCRNETQELKAQLHSCRMQKGTLESNLRNSLQELAKWRFEALRSRCVIINRENLLEENGIQFKNLTSHDFRIDEAELQNAMPEIGSESEISSARSAIKNDSETLAKALVDIKFDNDITNSLKINAYSGSSNSSRVEEIVSESKESKSEFERNLLKHSDECKKFPEHIKKENEIENSGTLQVKDIKKEVKDNSHFSIYEDTTQRLPAVKSHEMRETAEAKSHFNFSVLETTFRKFMDVGQENYASISSPSDVENSPDSKESVLPPDTNFFQIYEDTTQNLPNRKMCWAQSQLLVEDDVKEKENKENFNPDNNSKHINENCLDDERPRLNSQTVSKSSILVRNRDILCDENDLKSVRFDVDVKGECNGENKGKVKAYGKQTRTKSNVIIKRITVQSKLEKNTNAP